MMLIEEANGAKNKLPDGWRWVRLGEVCDEDRQIVEPHSRLAAKLPYLSLEHIEGNTGRMLREPLPVVIGEGKSTAFAFDTCHVLYGKLRPYLNKVALPDFQGRCTTELIPLLPKNTISREFLAWLLRRKETVEAAMREKTGSRMPRADMNNLLALQIPLPPLSEQKRIAAILAEEMATVERARAAAEARLEATKALPGAYLRRMFESEEAKTWPRKRLGEVCNERTGTRDPSLEPDIPFRYVDITGIDNKAKHIVVVKTLLGRDAPSRARRVILAGDVIVSTTRPNLNAVALVPPELDHQVCSTGFCVLRANVSLSPAYLFAFVQSRQFIRGLSDLVTGALYPAVTDGQVHAQFIPLPPIAEQKRIAAILAEEMAAVENVKKAVEEQLDAINKLPAALLRRAFSGEL